MNKGFRLGQALVLAIAVGLSASHASVKQEEGLEAARHAFESSDYSKAVEVLQALAVKEPRNGDVHLLLARTYYEMQQFDAAIASAEKAVAIDPQNSEYHEWLGRSYGEKADRSGGFTGLSLARKTHRELETAVQLNERNFSAVQGLIEFDCAAPGIAGGGEDKARPHIERLSQMDAAEGHYAAGNCRRQKKDFTVADAEFTKSLENHPKSADLIYDIGDYAMKRGQSDRLRAVVAAGEKAAPNDPRAKFYTGVALVLENKQTSEAEQLFNEYLKKAPKRNGYPSASQTHFWLGRLHENRNNNAAAKSEYETAVKLDSKNRMAQEALKKLKNS